MKTAGQSDTALTVPRTNNLTLTQSQEAKLVEYLQAKRTSLLADNAARIRDDFESWSAYWLDLDRRRGLEGSIFTLSNVPLPVYAMIAEHFVSRIEESSSAEEPFWHFEATGNREQEARDMTNYFSWKLASGGVHQAMLDSQLPTVLQSASVQKATYYKNEIHWIDRTARVLHDKRTNQPVESITNGPVIENEDPWEQRPDPIAIPSQMGMDGAQSPIPQDVQAGGAPDVDAGMESASEDAGEAPEPMEAQPAPVPAPAPMGPPPMRSHLVADPTIIFDPAIHEWKAPEGGLKRSQVVYQGAKSEHVRYDRIFCAMEAKSFEDSDVMELQDRAFDWFRANWLERPWAQWSTYAPNLDTGNTTAKTGQQDMAVPMAGGMSTGPTTKVEQRGYDTVNPVRRVAEFWVERDVLGDGTMPPQRFVCWLDIDLGVLVNYEWQAMVCPDLKRPYSVTSLSKAPNRWCGRSIWQRGKPLFEAVDRLFNGEFFRTLQQANPPKGGDPGAAVEEPVEIPFDPTKYWELKPGRTIDQLLQYAKVPDTNQRTQQVMEFIIFWIQLWLGVSNIAQGDYAAVPANSTATGISKTLQEASLLGRRWIRRKLEADEDHLTKLVKIIIATIDQNAQEVYEFNDGDRRKTATIMGADVKTLNIHVTVIEQQQFKEQDIARCKAGIDTLESYFNQLNPAVREVTLPFYQEILEDLGFKSAAQNLEATNEVPMSAAMGGQLVMGPHGKPMLPPPEPPAAPPEKDENDVKASMSIQVKWDQLTAPEREQLMGKVGVVEVHAPDTVAPSPNPADKPAPAKSAASS